MKALSVFILISVAFWNCAGNERKNTMEAESEINKMEDPVEHSGISSKCSSHLQEFEKLLAEYAALTEKYIETREIDEVYKDDLEQRMRNKLDELSKNSEIFADPDCTLAFTNAQQKFATYVQKMAMAKANQQ